MFFHIGLKQKVVFRDVRQRLRCPVCGLTTHKIFHVKNTISLFFIPFLNWFEEGMTCTSCGLTSVGSKITSAEIRSIVRSKAFGLRDYILGNMIPVFIALLIITPAEIILACFPSKTSYDTPYKFYDGCSAPEVGRLYIANLHAYQPDKFAEGSYKIVFLNSGQYPRYYNAQTQAFEEKSIYHYTFSHPVYNSEEDAIKALQQKDNFAQNYFDETNAVVHSRDEFISECNRSFKAIQVSSP